MGWYTCARNSVNLLAGLKAEDTICALEGDEAIARVADGVEGRLAGARRPVIVVLDGFMGAEFETVCAQLEACLKKRGCTVETLRTFDLVRTGKWMESTAARYVTNDPSFGRVCKDKRLKDLFDLPKARKLTQETLARLWKEGAGKKPVLIIWGMGAGIVEEKKDPDVVCYLDVTRERLLERMSEGTVTPLGETEPKEVFWKRMYYFDYPILNKHKHAMLARMHFYICDSSQPKQMLEKGAYDAVLGHLSRSPLVFKRVFMPGPWGGTKFSKYFNLKELANCAWNIEVSGMDSSMLIRLPDAKVVEVPFWNLFDQFPIEVIGPYCHKKYPGNFPIQVGIDDGWFKEPVPHERRAMPVHLHPDTAYVQKNFGESVGRYEVYYIVEAYEGANTMHGFHENADIEEFKRKVVESEEKKEPFKFDDYIKCWPSKAGDLYLIPAGTAHGTGGNQMILEMDTCPSANGTEYSFFLYDYCRSTWNDREKKWNGKPVTLQTRHGLKQCRFGRKEKYVGKTLRPKTKVVRAGKDWSEERFDSYRPMPYNIERLNFKKSIDANTKGRFFHFVCLTKGERAMIRSKKNPKITIELEYIQCAVIPACFGEYECVNLGKTPASIVRQTWKIG